MPIISQFYGIIIRMYFQQAEHNPPHIHAVYSGNIAEIDIRNGRILEGELPEKALALVREWLKLHKKELLEIWDTQKFIKIKPLE
ncbi:MAG: DUF4160 domain-containing protein [Candidatus Saccharibacteria bacterium]|nr:DUF4160 domain-containing protein [Candidatus Saccharibacteria bacterium]